MKTKPIISKGDKVLIIEGPPDRKGLYGTVETMLMNGAIIKLRRNHYTPVKFNHLKKVR